MAKHTITVDLDDEQEAFLQWYAGMSSDPDADRELERITIGALLLMDKNYSKNKKSCNGMQ